MLFKEKTKKKKGGAGPAANPPEKLNGRQSEPRRPGREFGLSCPI